MAKITITNQSGPVAVVDIEGIIGVPEPWQFDEPGQRVATYETFRRTVEALAEVRSPEVVVNIRSTGGNVNDALLIYDALAGLQGRITTRCFGYVASAATIIAQAASPGCREISANALYLVHKSVCAAEGNTEQMHSTLGMLEQTDARIASIYAVRSGRPVENFEALMRENSGNGRWLSPEEALAAGLADKKISDNGAGATVKDARTTNFKPINMTKKPIKTNGESLRVRAANLLARAARMLGAVPANFVYVDADDNELFSTASEVDDLAEGMEVVFPDETVTGGEFNLADGRRVVIEENVVTSIEGAEADEQAAENAALREQLAEAMNIIREQQAQIVSNYRPKNRVSHLAAPRSKTASEGVPVSKSEIAEAREQARSRRSASSKN